MIDSTFVWFEHVAIEIQKHIWDRWVDRFITLATQKGFVCANGKGGYKMVSPMSKSVNVCWWEAEYLVLDTIHDIEDRAVSEQILTKIVAPQMSFCNYQPKEHHINGFVQHLYSKLIADHRVIASFKVYANTLKAATLLEIQTAAKEVKHILRVRSDEECGLEVEFITPTSNPEQLYYVIGQEMRFIKDVRHYLDNSRYTVIGSFDVDERY